MTQTMRHILLAAATAGSVMIAPLLAQAGGLFSPVIKVDDQVVTQFELEQRTMLLDFLNIPGNPETEARKQLIEDRLKMTAARSFGLEITPEGLEAGVAEFAGRGNLKPEQLFELLDKEGIDKQALIDFVQVGLTWRELVNGRFGRRVSVSEADIDKAMAALTGGGSVRVLLSEVVIPLQQGYEEQIKDVAEQIAKIDSFAPFAEAAKAYSASKSRNQGGRLGWLPITQLPPALRPILMGLKPGETTSVIPMQGALAVFQMRAIEESSYRAPDIAAIEYGMYLLPGGRSPETLALAAKISSDLDTCDDLYGKNFGQPAELLEVTSAAPGDIPQDIAVELAKLDEGEVSYTLTRNNGADLMLLMLCGRTAAVLEDTSREDIARQLRNRQLESFANGYLEELRSQARIVE